MEIKVVDYPKYANAEDVKGGDVFSYDRRFWLMLEDKTPDGLCKAADLNSGSVAVFGLSTTVMPRPDLCLSQK
ncbi:hypothetical protein CH16_gp113 [Escherichia phage KBNP1711]|uniref:Uncharacterized protein n=1 Tax=Escherichia phage KBNP1711 TaxID=1436889 RepID=W6ASV1_9CAUD|nr:hypothetical protein CH16_gp113 [Escherichia phage KBNP1711]AHI60890.1 hypothetical protein ECBP3_0113 [Escherichia phage KBNP1711]